MLSQGAIVSILNAFNDYPQQTALFYEKSTTNSNGVVTDVWTNVSSCKVWIYTNSSIQTNQNYKFVNKETGNIIYDPAMMVNAAGKTFDITKKLKAIIDGIDYFIEGKDNIFRFNEVQILTYQKDVT